MRHWEIRNQENFSLMQAFIPAIKIPSYSHWYLAVSQDMNSIAWILMHPNQKLHHNFNTVDEYYEEVTSTSGYIISSIVDKNWNGTLNVMFKTCQKRGLILPEETVPGH